MHTFSNQGRLDTLDFRLYCLSVYSLKCNSTLYFTLILDILSALTSALYD